MQNEFLKTILSRGVDFYYSQRPRFTPDKEKLQECKIISHRGDHDNRTVLKNTCSAFDRAIQYGVWGITSISLKTLERAAHAIGKRLRIEFA